MFGFALLVIVAAIVPRLRRYFMSTDDVISQLTIPIVPNLIYASLLVVVGVGLLRRLRAAWWLLVIWFLALPELDRLVALVRGEGTWLQGIGLVLIAAVLVIAVRARSQFSARSVRGNGLKALALFLLGGLATLLVGTWLVSQFGSAPDTANATLHVMNSMFGDVGLVAPEVAVTSPWWVRALIGLMGAATVLGSAYLLFRAPSTPRPSTPPTRHGSAPCCASSATTTRSATSPPVGTSPSSGTPATRRRRGPESPTG